MKLKHVGWGEFSWYSRGHLSRCKSLAEKGREVGSAGEVTNSRELARDRSLIKHESQPPRSLSVKEKKREEEGRVVELIT